MDTDNGWPRVWAAVSDEELRDRLRQYLLLAATAEWHCVAEADRRGKAEMVDGAMGRTKTDEPLKRE